MVDDYTDANPPKQKDAPAGFITNLGGAAIIDTETSGTSFIYVPKSSTITFDVDVVDAPGLIGAVSATASKSLGVFDYNLLESAGKEQGQVKISYTTGTVFSSGTSTAGNETISILVKDTQEPPKSSSAIRPAFTLKTVNATCFSSKPLVGFYTAVTSGFDSETGSDYSSLTAEVEFRINAGGVNHPGLYRLTDGSFGLYPEQGFANNFINVTVCGNQIVDADEEFNGKFSGTLNSDGTITINWSNTFGDTGTTIMTPIEE
jgi:hypothetical protein